MHNVDDMAAKSPHVFEKYVDFGNPAAALCTRVREIRRIRKSSGEFRDPAAALRLHFAHAFSALRVFDPGCPWMALGGPRRGWGVGQAGAGRGSGQKARISRVRAPSAIVQSTFKHEMCVFLERGRIFPASDDSNLLLAP